LINELSSVSFHGDHVKATIPNKLYQAIIRIQGDLNIGFEEACFEAGRLIDP
jgi:hypothetical protein